MFEDARLSIRRIGTGEEVIGCAFSDDHHSSRLYCTHEQNSEGASRLWALRSARALRSGHCVLTYRSPALGSLGAFLGFASEPAQRGTTCKSDAAGYPTEQRFRVCGRPFKTRTFR